MERPDEVSTLFVYGGLFDAAHREKIIGRRVETASAMPRDYARVRRRRERPPPGLSARIAHHDCTAQS